MSPRITQPFTPDSEKYYVARPQSGQGRGVLVLHAWWGLNQFCRGFCDRLAQEGFVALAPDLYHGATAATIEEAKKLRARLKQETVAAEIMSAAEHLQAICGAGPASAGGLICRPGIGVVGFSLGGYWALWLADQKASPVATTIVFYGSRHGDYTASPSAFQFHLAETDDYVAASGVKKMQKSLQAVGREAEFYTYAGTRHWFFERDRAEAYNAPAAELAWRRTVEFLQKYI